ncbi:MAG: tetratricopeptide repeat protein, partial [Leptolyngbya sp.]|nr:tetratricopeptide repeat protein [Candidatus Melainabacteria bacterium]
ALLATGNLKEGIKFCKETLALNPDNRTCKSYLIVAEQKLRLPPTQINTQLLEQDKKLSETLAQHLQDSKWNEGINLLNTYIASHPKDYTAYLKRAYFFECQRNQTAAINDYTKVLELYPCQRNALEARAQAFLTKKQPGRAVDNLVKLVRVTPYHWNLRYRLAYALLDQKNFPASAREYNGLLLIYPHSVEALMGRAEVFLRTGKNKNAIADIKKAISYSPERSASFHYKLGVAYKQAGDLKLSKDEIAVSKKMGYDPKDF